MEGNSWGSAQGGPNGDPNDWRSLLSTDSRQKVVAKIMDILQKRLPIPGPEGLNELRKIASKFEEKIYAAATSQPDYMRRIAVKMHAMENRPNAVGPTTMSSNLPGSGHIMDATVAENIQSQARNVMTLPNQSHLRARMLSQSGQNPVNTDQCSSALQSTLPPMTGVNQNSMLGPVGQNPGLQNIPGMSQNLSNNPASQGISSSGFANSQRQIQGRSPSQQVIPQQQQQQQQSQNAQNLLYKHQIQQQQQQQLLKPKFQPVNISTSLSQSHIQNSHHQNLLQPTHLQTTQQPLIQMSSGLNQPASQQTQPSVIQATSLSGAQQNQQTSLQNTAQSILRQQSNTNIQQNQLLMTHSSVSDIQHQQQLTQQNVSNLHQQQTLGSQNDMMGLHRVQTNVSNIQPSLHISQANSTSHQQLSQHTQGQQPQTQLTLIQSQQAQLQQQSNPLPMDMQQRQQPSSTLHQTLNPADQQKQLLQSQRLLPEASLSSLEGDWQEEIHQKIKAMKELYLPELVEIYQKIAPKWQQQENQQPRQQEQLNKIGQFKSLLERWIHFLELPKSSILPAYKDKLPTIQKQIINCINMNRPKKSIIQQGQQQSGSIHSITQQPSQTAQLQKQDNHGDLIQSIQSTPTTSITNQAVNVATSMHQTIIGSRHQTSLGSVQQNTINPSQQSNINPLLQTSVQTDVNHLEPNSNMFQSPSIKQEHPIMPMQLKQQLQQLQQRHLQQQLIQQQQQQQQQQSKLPTIKPQSSGQVPSQHMTSQIHSFNDANEMKMRQNTILKPGGLHSQQIPLGQRSIYNQQLKSSSPFLSSQILQAASPQISQHASPKIEQQDLLPPIPKVGTPLQSTNSPFVDPSPSTPFAPSPVPGEDSEKQLSSVTSLSHTANVGHPLANITVAQAQSLAIGTPGISASPLLAEFTYLDGNQSGATASFPGKAAAMERPFNHLINMIKEISPEVLRSSTRDISSIASMIDRIAGSAPGNGSRTAVGEDLVAMTKCRLLARNFIAHDGNNVTKKMKRHASAMALTVSSLGSSLEGSELDSTATSKYKKSRSEAYHALLEEIREINEQLIDTVVDISDEDIDPKDAAVEGEEIIVKCSFIAVAITTNVKLQLSSTRLSPISPLRLLIPASYPNCSPMLLDNKLLDPSKDSEDLFTKAKSRFNASLRNLVQPTSLSEMAKVWDLCARKVILEYAQQNGGGSFSSRYGTWENCVSA